jgi:DNA-binding MarR family transcriptional regulator
MYVRTRPEDGARLSNNQLLVLYFLRDSGPQRVGVLAERAGMIVPALSRLLRSLTQSGYVMRERDPEDGRAYIVELTELGTEVVTEHRKRFIDSLSEIIADLTPAERTELIAATLRVDELLAAPDGLTNT